MLKEQAPVIGLFPGWGSGGCQVKNISQACHVLRSLLRLWMTYTGDTNQLEAFNSQEK